MKKKIIKKKCLKCKKVIVGALYSGSKNTYFCSSKHRKEYSSTEE